MMSFRLSGCIVMAACVGIFYACDRISKKGQDLADKTKQKVREKKEALVDKAIPAFNSFRADTPLNKKRFEEFFGFAPTPDVRGLYCFADRIGVDSKYAFAFQCDTATRSRIIKQLGLTLARQPDNFSKGLWPDFSWWDSAEIVRLTPYFKKDEQRVEQYMWFDEKRGAAYYLESIPMTFQPSVPRAIKSGYFFHIVHSRLLALQLGEPEIEVPNFSTFKLKAMIRQLKNIPDTMVGFVAAGEVTKEDFDAVILPAVQELVARTNELNYLLVLNTRLKNFTIGAWMRDAMLGISNITKWNRVAIVSDSEGVRLFTDLFSKVVPGEFKGYEGEETEEAIHWVAGAEAVVPQP